VARRRGRDLRAQPPERGGAAEQSDLLITQRLRDALGLIHVRVLDHLIIGRDSFYSMAQAGEI
jgi:DNA repair protein RadC